MRDERMREALEELYQACLSGNFYEDYDEASRLLGVARAALTPAGGGEVSRSQTAAPFASKPSAPLATYDADCGELIELAACLEAEPAFNPQTNAVYVRALRNAAASICGLAHALSQEGLVAGAEIGRPCPTCGGYWPQRPKDGDQP
jgi:hypothetical protein